MWVCVTLIKVRIRLLVYPADVMELLDVWKTHLWESEVLCLVVLWG